MAHLSRVLEEDGVNAMAFFHEPSIDPHPVPLPARERGFA
jgi:hypothetical protein